MEFLLVVFLQLANGIQEMWVVEKPYSSYSECRKKVPHYNYQIIGAMDNKDLEITNGEAICLSRIEHDELRAKIYTRNRVLKKRGN